jgi:hypothetical protein
MLRNALPTYHTPGVLLSGCIKMCLETGFQPGVCFKLFRHDVSANGVVIKCFIKGCFISCFATSFSTRFNIARFNHSVLVLVLLRASGPLLA